MPIKIRQNMFTPERFTMSAGAPVSRAARKMRELWIGAVVVTDGERECGIVTDRDIALWVVAEGRGPETTLAELLRTRTAALEADVPPRERAYYRAMRQEGAPGPDRVERSRAAHS